MGAQATFFKKKTKMKTPQDILNQYKIEYSYFSKQAIKDSKTKKSLSQSPSKKEMDKIRSIRIKKFSQNPLTNDMESPLPKDMEKKKRSYQKHSKKPFPQKVESPLSNDMDKIRSIMNKAYEDPMLRNEYKLDRYSKARRGIIPE